MISSKRFSGALAGGRRAVLVACVAIGAFVTTPARAQSEEAEALIREATELRRQNHDARALPLYERAYKLSRTPRTGAQLGLVEMALGYWLDSEKYLMEALASPGHPWIARNLEVLREALATVRSKIGEVTVTGGPDGAEVLVNGNPAGRLPMAGPVRLGEGQAEIVVRAAGHEPASRSLVVAGGSAQRVSLTLIRQKTSQGPGDDETVGPAAVAKPVNAPASNSFVTAPATPAQADTSSKEAGNEKTLRAFGWAAGIGAVAALTFGIVETVVTINKKNAFEDHTGPGPAMQPVPDCATAMLTPECRTLSEEHGRALNLAIAGYVVGGALAVGTAVLFIVARDQGQRVDSSSAAMACRPDLQTRGFRCQVSF